MVINIYSTRRGWNENSKSNTNRYWGSFKAGISKACQLVFWKRLEGLGNEIYEDSQSGKLDFLFGDAMSEKSNGILKEI